jgi:3-hydroxyacyl-CoA dehydrogenase
MLTVAIVGAGLIGRAWAIVFARAGCTVRTVRSQEGGYLIFLSPDGSVS